jgi:hypothetical protein
LGHKICSKNKKPAGLCCASGLKVFVISDLLNTPQRARPMVVMVMGAMNESHEQKA